MGKKAGRKRKGVENTYIDKPCIGICIHDTMLGCNRVAIYVLALTRWQLQNFLRAIGYIAGLREAGEGFSGVWLKDWPNVPVWGTKINCQYLG